MAAWAGAAVADAPGSAVHRAEDRRDSSMTLVGLPPSSSSQWRAGYAYGELSID